jgi:hypothetical protein
LSRGQRAGGDLTTFKGDLNNAKWLGELGGPLINRRDEDIELMSRPLKVVSVARVCLTV